MTLVKINIFNNLALKCRPFLTQQSQSLHVSASNATSNDNNPKRWLKYNEIVYPPQASDEEPRPAVRSV